MRNGTAYVPVEEVVVSLATFVAVLTIVTLAFATVAPEASVTVPMMVPVEPACARLIETAASNNNGGQRLTTAFRKDACTLLVAELIVVTIHWLCPFGIVCESMISGADTRRPLVAINPV